MVPLETLDTQNNCQIKGTQFLNSGQDPVVKEVKATTSHGLLAPLYWLLILKRLCDYEI